jgi:hypothetical protein
MKNFLARLVGMAAPAPVPIIEALSDEIETTDAIAADAAAEGRKERERLRDILNCEEAVGREKLAQYLAVSTDLTPTDARAILSASNREVPSVETAKVDPFTKAVWAEPEPLTEDTAAQIKRMQTAYSHVTGEPIAR